MSKEFAVTLGTGHTVELYEYEGDIVLQLINEKGYVLSDVKLHSQAIEVASNLFNEGAKQMKFYEATAPYTALIKAKDIESAKEEYVKSVADDEGDLDLKEVASDYAIARYSLALSEEGKEVPLHEKLSDLRSDEQMVLIVDPDLA